MISQALDNCSRQLYTLTAQYGSACLLGDKSAASSLNQSINNCLHSLDELVVQVHKLEREQRTHDDILATIEES